MPFWGSGKESSGMSNALLTAHILPSHCVSQVLNSEAAKLLFTLVCRGIASMLVFGVLDQTQRHAPFVSVHGSCGKMLSTGCPACM